MYNRPRVIPCLLIKNEGLVKTVRFNNPTYIGDPINAVRIFNEKCVDELIILDIMCSREKKGPNFELLSKIATEAFMPLAYGGGISNLEDIKRIIGLGYEKIVLNTAAFTKPELIAEASKVFGSQSIIVSIDTKPDLLGRYKTYINGGSIPVGLDPVDLAKKVVNNGAGEIFVNTMHKDGTMSGYDIVLLKQLANSVEVPVIACGGAKTIKDFYLALHCGGVNAVSAGSMFVYYGKYKGVLITFPNEKELIDGGIYTE